MLAPPRPLLSPGRPRVRSFMLTLPWFLFLLSPFIFACTCRITVKRASPLPHSLTFISFLGIKESDTEQVMSACLLDAFLDVPSTILSWPPMGSVHGPNPK